MISHWKRKFVVLWVGQACSIFTSMLSQYALIWYLTDRTGSPAVLSMAMLCGMLPQGVLSLFTGSFADRFDRRYIMAIADGAIDGTAPMTDGTYDMIILCLHQRIAIQMVQEALPKIPAGTILVDTCGLKGRMVRDLTYRCRKAGVRYVGTHPMAGREKNGYYASIPNLFQNANLIVTPVDGTDEAALDTVKELADQMGFGKIVTATPMWHDNMIAYTSQLAHVVSSSYVKDFCMDDALSFSGGSFQDMTRVARLDEDMWTELFLDDADYLTDELDILIGHLQEYADALKSKDAEHLRALLRDGREKKATAGGN